VCPTWGSVPCLRYPIVCLIASVSRELLPAVWLRAPFFWDMTPDISKERSAVVFKGWCLQEKCFVLDISTLKDEAATLCRNVRHDASSLKNKVLSFVVAIMWSVEYVGGNWLECRFVDWLFRGFSWVILAASWACALQYSCKRFLSRLIS